MARPPEGPGPPAGTRTGRRQAPDIAGRTDAGCQPGKGDTGGLQLQSNRSDGGGRGADASIGSPRWVRIFRITTRVFDGSDHTQAATTPRIGQDVHRERVAEEVRPRVAAERTLGDQNIHTAGRLSGPPSRCPRKRSAPRLGSPRSRPSLLSCFPLPRECVAGALRLWDRKPSERARVASANTVPADLSPGMLPL